MRTITGLIHVHSTFSHDGWHSLEELGRFGASQGYSFIGMSEHSDDLDGQKVIAYVKECLRFSSPECLIIPGIEFSCDMGFHLIGLGVKHYTDLKDPIQVSQFIRDNGGVAILAHPIRHGYRIPLELARTLDGIEVWNAGYDGRFVPDDRTLRLLNDFRRRNGFLTAFGGEDLHRITDPPRVQIRLKCEDVREDVVLRALRHGEFEIFNSYFRFDARQPQGALSLAGIVIAQRAYSIMKRLRDLLGLSR